MAKIVNSGGRYENIKEKNLHDEEIPCVTVRDNKTKPRNNLRERQIPVGRKKPARNSQTVNNERTTVILGRLHNKECSGNKTSQGCGTSGCYQAVP